MLIIFERLDTNHKDWNNIAEQLSKVDWIAGKSLADKMKNKPFYDWEKVIIAKTNEEELIAFCEVSHDDGLKDKSFTPFIGSVFVIEKYRGNRLSEKLLKQAENYLQTNKFDSVYLVSGEVGLYEKYGYTKLKTCETIYGHIESLFEKKLS